MKVLLINGSSRQNGCTFTALDEVARALEGEGVEAEILHIGSGPIRGCIGCGGCARKGDCRCVFGDDRVNEALDRMAACDGLVIGSPVHYASASGGITSFMDRGFYAGRQAAARQGRSGCRQRASCRHNRCARSASEILCHQRHAHRAQPILAHGARQHARGSQKGRGRPADHAHTGPVYGLHDQELCARARKRPASAPAGGAAAAHKFHPLNAFSYIDVLNAKIFHPLKKFFENFSKSPRACSPSLETMRGLRHAGIGFFPAAFLHTGVF